jgi:serine/threonine-protein kinase
MVTPARSERAWTPAQGALVAGRYRIEGTLGQGGMGVVVGARDEKEGRSVALKVLQMEGHVNLERFLREARVATKIDSVHVVKVFDVGVVEEGSDQPFLVMERLDGSDFGARLKKTGAPLPLPTVADCMVQVCEALAHAHGAGIIHRDIKASNVFEHKQADGTTIVKVLDFGISKYRAANAAGGAEPATLTTTNEGGFLGSPPYMSPEHVRDPRSVDGRADLWSLGVVAYRLLSGRFPFRGESTGEVLAAILEQEPAPLRELGLDVPREVDVAIARSLARSREERFRSSAEMAAAFAPFASPRWCMLHLQVAEVARRSPAVLVPEPPSKGDKRISRVDVEPATLTVAPPVSVSQPPPPPAARSSRSSMASLVAPPTPAVGFAPPRRSAAPLVLAVGGVLAVAALAVGGLVFARHVPAFITLGRPAASGSAGAAATAAATAAPSAGASASPDTGSLDTAAVTASAASGEPASVASGEPPSVASGEPASDEASSASAPAAPAGTKRHKPRRGSTARPHAGGASRPGAPPTAATSAAPPGPAPSPTKRPPDLHPNPYGTGE